MTYTPKILPEGNTEMKPTFPSSAAARDMENLKRNPNIGIEKYPWRSMEVGTSFHVAPNEANYKTISTSCYKWSKKLGKRFRAVNHGENGIEVARLSDPIKEE